MTTLPATMNNYGLFHIPHNYFPLLFIFFLAFYIAGLNFCFKITDPNIKLNPSLKRVTHLTFGLTVLLGLATYYFYSGWSATVDIRHLTDFGLFTYFVGRLGGIFWTFYILGRFIKRNKES